MKVRRVNKITPEIVNAVKALLKTNGVNDTARNVGISQYVVSCIKAGRYDDDKPLQDPWKGRCPITGFVIDKYV